MYFFAAKYVTKKRREKMVKMSNALHNFFELYLFGIFSSLSQLTAQVLTPKMFISCWFPDKKSEWQYHNNLADEIFFLLRKSSMYYLVLYIFWLALLFSDTSWYIMTLVCLPIFMCYGMSKMS